jgi:hypothetical protein
MQYAIIRAVGVSSAATSISSSSLPSQNLLHCIMNIEVIEYNSFSKKCDDGFR